VRILFDVNVILDVLLDRKPHARASSSVFAAVETGAAEGLISAHAVTTIHYLIRREMKPAHTRQILSAIFNVLAVAEVNGAVIAEAFQLTCPDFEDAVTAASARQARCDCIVTRDPKGFRGSPVRCFTPEAIVPVLRAR
jgi:predicted nucleic acid-binding protein